MKIIALVPARSGSKRVIDKNIRDLKGKPLMAYTIEIARRSKVFDKVILCTDSENYAAIGKKYGAEVPYTRDTINSEEDSPDILWIFEALNYLDENKIQFDAICILRPTSPFRTTKMLIRAVSIFIKDKNYDSLRAVQKVSEHPGKMWREYNSQLLPLLPFSENNIPWHSNQTNKLPEVFVQNASLELVWKNVVKQTKTISGTKIKAFVTEGYEGFDINSELDFLMAETLLEKNLVRI